MDKKEPLLIRHMDGNWYTPGQLAELIAPLYQEYEAHIKSCISGLTQYAAGLAARHQEARLPELRTLITEMAEFWNLENDESKDAHLKLREKYGGAFDQAVSAARASSQAPVLSREVQDGILSGLELYAGEMTASGGMEPWVRQCEALAEQLQEEWAGPEMGGMRLE